MSYVCEPVSTSYFRASSIVKAAGPVTATAVGAGDKAGGTTGEVEADLFLPIVG